jgi:hypothetical protein
MPVTCHLNGIKLSKNYLGGMLLEQVRLFVEEPKHILLKFKFSNIWNPRF